ncbi:hypothetical protein K7I13_05145 [Brucepastera parasyntrophica]|uniref:hypothetical protein n=1 Tax=Brucepastera parasyntrophica TaxID=2880008 RepID=UPI00210C5500|nr:hypothetical protein [Brucepastera parasyntrophica]ULQ60661.1 hypothetical protein K7I13_05145 [Brucepastera parasyntrophica]
MTIAARNRFIRLFRFFSLAFLVVAVLSIIQLLLRHEVITEIPLNRPFKLLDSFTTTLQSPYAAIIAIGILPLYSVLLLSYIHFTFEKTQTVEITFFAAAVFAVSLETFRLFIPLFHLWINSTFLSVTVSRIVLFSRFFVLLTLLASVIFNTEQAVQMVGSLIFLLAFVSVSLAYAFPMNTEIIGSNFLVAQGYNSIVNYFFAITGILTVLSYIVLGKQRGIAEYTGAAAGILLMLLGYVQLIFCDTWLFLVTGAIMLFFGSWLYLKRIHHYYLWQ